LGVALSTWRSGTVAAQSVVAGGIGAIHRAQSAAAARAVRAAALVGPERGGVDDTCRRHHRAAGAHHRACRAFGGGPPVVVWLHAGGMVAGSAQFEGPIAGFLARALNAVVVAPNYRLAPEHRHPAALDDVMTTLAWVGDHPEQLGVDPGRVAVAGASAGAGLAAVAAQRCRDEGIALRAQALLYPMLDDRTLSCAPSTHATLVWGRASNQFAWTSYLGISPGAAGDAPRYAAAARAAQLGGLAPAWLGVGGGDLLCEEACRYADQLRLDGTECELIVVPGMYHAADMLVPWATSMRRLHAGMAAHLRRHLAAPCAPAEC
jgi:acetyl esterase/lipase